MLGMREQVRSAPALVASVFSVEPGRKSDMNSSLGRVKQNSAAHQQLQMDKPSIW